MSNALAIATATQALALLIANNLQPEVDIAVKVETRRPPAEPPTEPTLTVFLYQVTPNASMRHHDLPTRSSDGTLLKRPAAPLDLHYLISAYGEETELVGQRLIGCVVRTLHEIPVLPRELIEQAAERPYLAGSDLADAIQKVRFTPTQMDVDETSKLWGMLHQTPYTLSVAYQGVLVFVDGREEPVPPKPVERHTVHVAPFGAPGAPEPPALPEPAGARAVPNGDGAAPGSAGSAGEDDPAKADRRRTRATGQETSPATAGAGAADADGTAKGGTGGSRPGAPAAAEEGGNGRSAARRAAAGALGGGATRADGADGGAGRAAGERAPRAATTPPRVADGDGAAKADRHRRAGDEEAAAGAADETSPATQKGDSAAPEKRSASKAPAKSASKGASKATAKRTGPGSTAARPRKTADGTRGGARHEAARTDDSGASDATGGTKA